MSRLREDRRLGMSRLREDKPLELDPRGNPALSARSAINGL